MAKTLRSKTANIFIYVLLGLLMVGLAGFGAGNFGGHQQTVGKVGDVEIDANQYARALQQDLQQLQRQLGSPTITMSQARAFGRDRAVLQDLMAIAALESEVTRIGLSVGDRRVRDRLLQMPAFQDLTGAFDSETYRQRLRHNGTTVREFETQLRTEAASSLLQLAIVDGIVPSETYAKTLMTFLAERRSFEWARLSADILVSPPAAPTAAERTAYYEANPDDFTLPETRNITYIWLTPDMLVDQIDVADEDVAALYQSRIGEYQTQERRLVERLIYLSEDDAAAAKARLDAGTADFGDLVAERGLSLSDIDLGDVAQSDLPAAVGSALFSMSDIGVAGPLMSDLGPALYRVNAILQAQNTPLADVRDDLRAEFATDRARRQILDGISDIDDLLAGGATLEEIADETDMQLATLAFRPDTSEGIAAYEEFRRAAQSVEIDDFAEIATLSDDGIFALRLNDVVPPTLQSQSDVEDALEQAVIREKTQQALRTLAEGQQAALEAGADFSSLGFSAIAEEALTRDAFVADAPTNLVQTAFALDVGKTQLIADATDIFVVRLGDVLAPDETDEETRALQDAVANQAANGTAQDIFDLFRAALQAEADIAINQHAINAIYAQFP